MASNIFKFSGLNPFRWTQKNAVTDPRYNAPSFDQKIDNNRYAGPYFQKWQTNDITYLQFLSDFILTLKIYNYKSWDNVHGDTLFSTIAIPAVTSFPIVGVSFTAYEATIDFSTFPEGWYFAEITYTDENSVVQTWQSSPLDVSVKHAKTLLYEYWNTRNDKGVIFDTGIKFNMRIEGSIREFTPDSLSSEMEDQNYNTTTLNDIPYRTFKNYIGRAEGLPDWIIDKINTIYSVNYKSVNGMDFNKVDGAKFEIVRPSQTENEDAYMSIKIIQQDNFFLQQFQTGDGNQNEGDYIVIKQAKIFDEVGASFSVAGVFNINYNLIRLAVENKGGDTFLLKIGTSTGANDIAQFNVGDPDENSFVSVTESLDIGHVFNAPTDVFITVPGGVNLKVTFDYNQYDAVNVTPETIASPYQFFTIYPYIEITPGNFDIHWSVTGAGNVGTQFEGCALMGTNGLPDYTGAGLICWDRTQPLERGEPIGVPGNNVNIDTSVLPDEGVAMFTVDINMTAGDTPTPSSNVARARSVSGQPLNYEILKGVDGVVPTLGLTAPLGAGDPFNITNYGFQTPMFVRLT